MHVAASFLLGFALWQLLVGRFAFWPRHFQASYNLNNYSLGCRTILTRMMNKHHWLARDD